MFERFGGGPVDALWLGMVIHAFTENGYGTKRSPLIVEKATKKIDGEILIAADLADSTLVERLERLLSREVVTIGPKNRKIIWQKFAK